MGQSKLEPMISKVKENWQRKMLALKDDLFKDLDGLSTVEAPAPPPEQDSMVEAVLDALGGFRSCVSQVELLTYLLDSAQEFAPRSILFIIKERKTHGWSGRGFGQQFLDSKLKKVRWPIETYPELIRAVKEKEGFCINFSDLSAISDEIKGFEGFIPLKACFYPILVRSKVAAVLYADSGSESSMKSDTTLEMLTYLAGLELTMITMKLKKAQPKPARPAPAPEEPEPEPETAPEQPQPETETPPPTAPKKETPAGFAELEAVARGRDTKPQDHQATLEEEAPPEVQELPEAAVEEDSVEVQKARRVARVLVSDIILYHEAEVAQGQAQGNMYELLKTDIDRSLQHYRERVGDSVPAESDFFKEELIRQLADGNPDLLGDLPF